ncbi:bestrophin, RFP-TM, chloride channel domain-containing protein [Ditylenchus destructor]|nr:bestrophin, RFP-TM, chloride channel domain-containing protein [Ditylenchus destructor]
MNVNQQKFFAELANYTYSTTEYLPLTFMLGFFVKIVVDRWRDIFANIGFIDNAASLVSNFIRGSDEETVMIRRNILRYLCLTQVLVLRDTSIKVRRRFPTIDCVVQAGFLQPHELEMMDKLTNGFGKYWIPINWACALAMKMREKGRINADPPLVAIMQAIADFKLKLQTLCNYDWVPVPIAYPQVVFLTIRVYFLICCISRQFMINESSKHRNIFDLYFPFMTVLQFIFYMGWLKVAEALLNPLGEDDDDFESNYIIDRNLTIAIYMADECCNQYPEQKPDCFDPRKGLLYSEDSFMMPNHALIGSAVRIKELSHLNDKIKMYPLCYESPSSYSANEDFTCDIPPLEEK